MRLHKEFHLIIVLLLFALNSGAQVFAPAANDSFSAAYNPPGGIDRVFIYNRPVYQGARTATITAVSSDRQVGWNFQWEVWNGGSQLYTIIPGITNGWISTLDTITVNSGYRVTISNASDTSVYRFWIVFNDYKVEITNKDSDNKLLFGYFNCSSLDLRADTTQGHNFYFNPDTKTRINIFNNYSIRWRTDNPDATIPANRLVTRVTSPPSEDTWYILNLTDRFKLVRSDSVFYKSIQSKAKISSEYINLSNKTEYPGHDYGSYYKDDLKSAPGKYKFDISASKNSARYRIDFGDGEMIDTNIADTSIVHEYKRPGTYKAVLTTKSDKPYECVDSASEEVDLKFGSFGLPNVFTPDNGDILKSSNDVFRSGDISVVTIDIAIFDRAGIRMHTYSGNIRDWTGWDGKVKHSNRDAPEGVYFYVVSALFYYKDPLKPIDKSVYNGFFHLYRQ